MEVATLFDSAYLPVTLQSIREARQSIDVSMFLAQEPRGASLAILDALASAAQRGVRVRALFEDEIASNRKWVAILNRYGADARLDDARIKLHDKAILIDGRILIVGSHNWSNAALTANREASLLIEADDSIFRNWSDRFEDGMNAGTAIRDETISIILGTTIAASHIQPRFQSGRGRIVTDSDYVKASEQIIGLMKKRFTAALYYISIHSLTRGGSLRRFFVELSKKAPDFPCEIILDQMEIDDREIGERDNDTTIVFLNSQRIKAAYDPKSVTHHVKAVAVDGRYVVLGSHNWTISSTQYNRETSIILDSVGTARELEAYLQTLKSHPNGSPKAGGNWIPMEDLVSVH